MEIFEGLEHIVRENEPLAPYTWFRLGGLAQYFSEPTNVDELQTLVRRCRETETPIRLLGGGSNILVREEGAPGVVVYLSAASFAEVAIDDRIVTAGGGAKLGHVVSASVGAGLAGLEQLVGIPGTIGGALHGNAGTQGGAIGQWTRSATVMTHSGEIVVHPREVLRFSHRQSSLDELVVLRAEFELEPEASAELTKRMQKLWIVKRANEPLASECTGCIFKDPAGGSAASVIEAAGFKSASVGEARISDRNANFIVVAPQASTRDVLRLIDLVRTGVSDRLGVELELNLDIW